MINEDKLKSKIEGLKSNLIHGACSSQIAMETRCKEEAYNEVLAIIGSMQEEHKLKPKFQEGNKIVYVGERKELDTDEHTILYVYDDMYVTTWGKKIPFKFQDDYQLVEEPVSIWHDASEKPNIKEKGNIFVITSLNGEYIGSRYYNHNDVTITFGNYDKWAYLNDLLNLSNVERTVKDWKEMPVSKDLEVELKNYLNSDGYINTLGISGYLLVARHFANWQKNKMMEDAVDGEVGYWNQRGLSVNMDLPRTLEEDDKVKLIIIKEDKV